MGESDFDAAWAQGAALSTDEAIPRSGVGASANVRPAADARSHRPS